MCTTNQCNAKECLNKVTCNLTITDDDGEDQGIEYYCEEHKPNFLKINNDF
jgi:hypothetical protein